MGNELVVAGVGANRSSDASALDVDIEKTRQECRSMVRRRALLAASVSLLPIPGVDFITDVALLLKLLPDINTRFGLSEAQIAHLSPTRKAVAYQVMVGTGGMLARKFSTSQLLSAILRRTGLRLGTMEATRLVPIIGQGVAAVIAYLALRFITDRHIEECIQIVEKLRAEPA